MTKPTMGSGIRTTKQRQLILDIIRRRQGHLTADEIFQSAKLEQPNISLGTVYRNLELLSQIGILTKAVFVDGKARYELAASHHHHLICLSCGGTVDLPLCPIDETVAAFITANKFKVCHHHFEIYGYCAQCINK